MSEADLHGYERSCPCNACVDRDNVRRADPTCCYECGADPRSPAPDGVTYAADGTPLCGECGKPLLGAALTVFGTAVAS